ncbi:unnamed protein product [Rhodiola kirilowii]
MAGGSSQIFQIAIFILIIVDLNAIHVLAGHQDPHVIQFKSPNLYPEGIAYDSSAQHFLVGSLHSRSIHSVSDAGVVETFLTDTTLPPNSTILGLTVDLHYKRLLAVIHSLEPLPPFNALAAYDLRTRRRLYLAELDAEIDSIRQVANDVAADFSGNAFVTNSASNFIWKVNADGESSIFSKSPAFSSHPVDQSTPYSECGLNGVVYNSKGYLLVAQSNTGKLFRVDAEDGTARTVILPKDLSLADGVAVRKDGVVLVVSPYNAWFLTSHDSWMTGGVKDEITLDADRFPTSVTVGSEGRVYVLYGHVLEGIKGNVEREEFSIEEIRSTEEEKDDMIGLYVIIGLGLVIFFVWRFQMRQLVDNMNRKNV